MRPLKSRKPFTLYRKQTKTGLVWYARFWDDTTRRYAVTRSTGIPVEGKRQRRYEAEQAARNMLARIPFKSPADQSFIEYAEKFWTPDGPYVRECALVKKKPLSAYYVQMNHDDARRHIKTFPGFRNLPLHSLTAGILRDWLMWMAEKGLSGRRINHVLQGMRIAVRYAVDREELEHDPFKNIREAEEQPKEKGVLTPSEASSLIQAPVADPRTRLAVLLGILCGLRRGEVRGLLWGDIGDGIITVCHNWIDGEGVKAPKCKGGAVRENRRFVPFPASVAAAFEEVRRLSRDLAPDRFVFEGMRRPEEPLSNNFFRRALTVELLAIGIDNPEQRRRNITFHSCRHTFITLGRLSGISDMEIRALAGHRSGAMTEWYSHTGQVIDFDGVRQKLQKAIGE